MGVTVLALFALQACSNQYREGITQRYASVKQQVTELGQKINAGQIANALLIKTYARQLAESKPALQDVAQALGRDATSAGPMYQGLLQRLERIDPNPENKDQYVAAFQELEALWAAADPVIYNDSLMDVVNTLADLSGGTLARINVPQEADTASLASATGAVPGSYLVGNPNYGEWAKDDSGNSFWQWYGQYRLLTDVVGGLGGLFFRGPVYYDSWYKRPRYSYYDDYGRSTYGSYADRKGWKSGRERLASQGIRPPKPKNYASVAGQKRVSTYASMRSKSTADLRAGRMPGRRRNATVATKRASTFFGGSSRGTAVGARGRRSGK